MDKNKPISMKKISELSGVSTATVSRVINNNGRFSSETKKRVESVIKEYGYRPNMMAKGLRKRKVQNIGIVVPDITNEFFAKIVLEIQKQLYNFNYSALIYNTDELYELEQEYVSMLAAQNVSGIIYIAGGSWNKPLQSNDVPTVFVDRKPHFDTMDNKNFVTIESDNVEGGYIATKYLINNSSKAPAILMDNRSISPQQGRFNGYKKALSEFRLSFNEDNVIMVDRINHISSYNAIKERLAKALSFDGLFCTTDWLAMGAIKAFEEASIKIPEEMNVVGFDNISISEFGRIPFTTVSQDINQMGKIAAQMIIKMIIGENLKKRHYVLPVELIRRNSNI